MSKLRVFVLVAVAFSAACTSFADKADYADYRVIRLARVEEQRLLAMTRYAQKHPDGQWYNETQAERRALEARVFEEKKSTRAGLEYYLRAYPDGVYVSQARARLSAMNQVKQRRVQERERAEKTLQDKRSREVRLRRTWVTRFFDYWTRVFLSIGNWGDSMDEIARGNPEFSRSFGSSPRPVCTPEQCIKQYRGQFAIPVPSGTRFERSIEINLRLWIKQGRLQGAEILLPNRGFSRWFELENGLLVVDEEPALRQKVIRWSLAKLEPLIKGLVSELEPLEGHNMDPIRPLPEGIADNPPFTFQEGDVAEPEIEPPDMVFEPLKVNPEVTQPTESVQVPAQSPTDTLSQGRPLPSVWAYSTQFLRITIFSASSDSADMEYDGIAFMALEESRAHENSIGKDR